MGTPNSLAQAVLHLISTWEVPSSNLYMGNDYPEDIRGPLYSLQAIARCITSKLRLQSLSPQSFQFKLHHHFSSYLTLKSPHLITPLLNDLQTNVHMEMPILILILIMLLCSGMLQKVKVKLSFCLSTTS